MQLISVEKSIGLVSSLSLDTVDTWGSDGICSSCGMSKLNLLIPCIFLATAFSARSVAIVAATAKKDISQGSQHHIDSYTHQPAAVDE